jgi:hypothetical protein
MFHNKQALIGIYGSTSSGTGAQLVNFSVTTTSGNVLVDWGDGTSIFINSNTPTNHTFFCPDYSAPTGNLWNDINTCV